MRRKSAQARSNAPKEPEPALLQDGDALFELFAQEFIERIDAMARLDRVMSRLDHRFAEGYLSRASPEQLAYLTSLDSDFFTELETSCWRLPASKPRTSQRC
jgi:hypothetical protein